jgi:hypothetical protein
MFGSCKCPTGLKRAAFDSIAIGTLEIGTAMRQQAVKGPLKRLAAGFTGDLRVPCCHHQPGDKRVWN